MRPAALLLGLALLGLLATLYVRARRSAPERDGKHEESLVLDSLKAADARQDWPSTLLWVERLGRMRPNDPVVLRSRGTAWSNFAVDQPRRRVHSRPARRTSLERIECLRRAAGLMDSSAYLSTETADWAEASQRLAELYQNLGLPGDALAVYQTMHERAPREQNSVLRAYWLRALFRDPVHPDTSAYHDQMKRLGVR